MIALNLTIKEEDLNDFTLLKKGIFAYLEEGSFYSVKIIIKTDPNYSLVDRLLYPGIR
jgi:hypothetical protein